MSFRRHPGLLVLRQKQPGLHATTDPRGSFVIPRVAAGYVTTTTEAYTLLPGQTIENVTIRLPRGPSVRGRVIDTANGAPVGDVRIKVFEGELREEFLSREYGWGALDPISDEDGRFELGGLPEGRAVQVVAWRQGYAPAVELSWRASGRELVLKLRRGGRARRAGGTALPHRRENRRWREQLQGVGVPVPELQQICGQTHCRRGPVAQLETAPRSCERVGIAILLLQEEGALDLYPSAVGIGSVGRGEVPFGGLEVTQKTEDPCAKRFDVRE